MPSGRKAGLTRRQVLFIREYLVDLNASQAALRAGYSKRSYAQRGEEVLRQPHVAAAIKQAMEERAKRIDITADRVLEELAKIGFADIRDLMEWDEESSTFVPSGNLDDNAAAVVAAVKSKTRTTHTVKGESKTTVELEIKTYDKVQALTQIGRHLGMFTDKVALTLDDMKRALEAGSDEQVLALTGMNDANGALPG